MLFTRALQAEHKVQSKSMWALLAHMCEVRWRQMGWWELLVKALSTLVGFATEPPFLGQHWVWEKSSVPTKDWDRLAWVCPGVSSGGVGQQLPAGGVRRTECKSMSRSRFEGGRYYHYYTYYSLASGQTTARKPSPAHQQKTGLKIYWTWPFALLEQPWRPHVQGKRNPSKDVGTERGDQRADRLKLQSQTTSQSDHTEQSLV